MSVFLDTNILVYAQLASDKGEAARRLIQHGGIISVQVMNEFTNVLKRKLEKTWPEIEAALSDAEEVFDIRDLTLDQHQKSVKLAREHRLSIYDSLIVVAALEAKCSKLFSEDLQHGRRFGRLEVVNPFM